MHPSSLTAVALILLQLIVKNHKGPVWTGASSLIFGLLRSFYSYFNRAQIQAYQIQAYQILVPTGKKFGEL